MVQHINTFARGREGDWLYTFTQEWPVSSQRHQLSYTVPVLSVNEGAERRTGLSDIALNYRYQAGRLNGTTAFAPRVSILLPVGASERALGRGGPGAQFNLPFSAELPASLVAHSNAGATFTRHARNTSSDRASTVDYTLGQSLIWLARPKLNLMVEAVWTRAQEVIAPERTVRSTEMTLSPGIRGAIDLKSGLQIVPGIAFPLGIGPSRGEKGVFFYLSLEHSFARGTQ